MEWEMVVAVAVATPIILLPVAFVWYLNLKGIYAALKEVGTKGVTGRAAPGQHSA